MILNLAGFRIKILCPHGQDTIRLSLSHASLLSKGPEDFKLLVIYSDRFLFGDPLLHAIPAAIDLPRLAEGQSDWCSKVDYSDRRILLQGIHPEPPHHVVWEMQLDPSEGTGQLCLPHSSRNQDPLQYPVDALLIFYLLIFNTGIIVHASGAGFHGNCSIFAGESGAGKSTIARYCQVAGARILHEDRIVIRKTGEQFTAYRMPLFPGNLPVFMPLETIYFIEQSDSIYEIPLPPQVAFEKLACHSVQHPFHPELVERQISNIISIAQSVPCYRLGFPPDPEVGRYLSRPPDPGTGFAWKPIALCPAQKGVKPKIPDYRTVHDAIHKPGH